MALTGNDPEEAFRLYRRSRAIAKGGIKSNYNYVMSRISYYPEQDTLIKYLPELDKAEIERLGGLAQSLYPRRSRLLLSLRCYRAPSRTVRARA